MDISTSKSARDIQLAIAKHDAEIAVQNLKSPSLLKVIAYLKLLGEEEMIRCCSLDDLTVLRRSQGKVSGITTVVELLGHEPVERQSAVLSREV